MSYYMIYRKKNNYKSIDSLANNEDNINYSIELLNAGIPTTTFKYKNWNMYYIIKKYRSTKIM